MRRNESELIKNSNRLQFEAHRIRFDRTGKYEEPLDREFPVIIKLFRFKHNAITPGLTWHERLELFVPLDGLVRMRMGDRVAEVGKGEILIVDNLKLHATVDYPGFNTRVIVISFLAEFVYSLGSPSHDYFLLLPFYAPAVRRTRVVRRDADHLEQMHGAIARLLNCYFQKASCYQVGCKAFLLELLYYLAQELQVADVLHSDLIRQQERAARLRPVFDFVAHNYPEAISLSQAAALAKMSQPQFIKLFPKVAGMTFVSYVTHVRLSHAVRLLKETALTVAEVASEVGFTDQSYFDRRFRTAFGQTPRAFRSNFSGAL
jgi:AraC-like DNA-binding protein